MGTFTIKNPLFPLRLLLDYSCISPVCKLFLFCSKALNLKKKRKCGGVVTVFVSLGTNGTYFKQ